MNTVRESKMKCDAFWGGHWPPHKYMVEFSKEEVEELASKSTSTLNYALFGAEVWASLVAQYEKHNKGLTNEINS